MFLEEVLMLKLTIALACVFSACAKPPAHVKATDVTMKSYCKNASAENNIKILGNGGYFDDRLIRGFYADFESGVELSKEDAKTLLVSLVERCITDLNNDSNLSKHLVTSPVAVEHVSISIGFVAEDRTPFPNMSQIHLFENKIYYSEYKAENKTYVCTQSEAFELSSHTASIPTLSEQELPNDEEIELPN